jgi:hypothetical protein
MFSNLSTLGSMPIGTPIVMTKLVLPNVLGQKVVSLISKEGA